LVVNIRITVGEISVLHPMSQPTNLFSSGDGFAHQDLSENGGPQNDHLNGENHA
jgi:hypothetical protein